MLRRAPGAALAAGGAARPRRGARVPGQRDGGRRGPLFLAGLPRRERALPERSGDLPGGLAAAPHLRGQHPPVSGARREAARQPRPLGRRPVRGRPGLGSRASG